MWDSKLKQRWDQEDGYLLQSFLVHMFADVRQLREPMHPYVITKSKCFLTRVTVPPGTFYPMGLCQRLRILMALDCDRVNKLLPPTLHYPELNLLATSLSQCAALDISFWFSWEENDRIRKLCVCIHARNNTGLSNQCL